MRITFLAIVLASVFALACVPSEPSPNSVPALTSPPSKEVAIYPQLEVRAYPEGSAYVLLNPVPLDGGFFPSGMIVTIEILPGPGWEIDEDGWKGPVFEIGGDTAKVEMISTQHIVIKMRPAFNSQTERAAPKPQASEAALKPQAERPTLEVVTADDDGTLPSTLTVAFDSGVDGEAWGNGTFSRCASDSSCGALQSGVFSGREVYVRPRANSADPKSDWYWAYIFKKWDAETWIIQYVNPALTNSSGGYLWNAHRYSDNENPWGDWGDLTVTANYDPQAERPVPKTQVSGATSVDQLNYLTLNTYANPTVGGTVTGGGRYPSGAVVQVVATPNPGYTLRGWTTPGGIRCAQMGYMMCSINIVKDVWVTADFKLSAAAPVATPAAGRDIRNNGLLDWHLERYGETSKVLEVSETGSQYKFKLKLWSQPSSDAVLSIVSDDIGEVAVSPGTLTFTNSNWDIMQTVTLTGVDDTDQDGNQTTIIKVSGVGDGWTSLRGEALYVVTEDDDLTLKPSRLLGQGTGNTPPRTPPPTESTCLSIESYSGAIDDSGTFVQTIGQLPIRRGETISVSGTDHYDGTWKVLQYFRYHDIWGYRIEKKWQGFPDDKDPMACTFP